MDLFTRKDFKLLLLIFIGKLNVHCYLSLNNLVFFSKLMTCALQLTEASQAAS